MSTRAVTALQFEPESRRAGDPRHQGRTRAFGQSNLRRRGRLPDRRRRGEPRPAPVRGPLQARRGEQAAPALDRSDPRHHGGRGPGRDRRRAPRRDRRRRRVHPREHQALARRSARQGHDALVDPRKREDDDRPGVSRQRFIIVASVIGLAVLTVALFLSSLATVHTANINSFQRTADPTKIVVNIITGLGTDIAERTVREDATTVTVTVAVRQNPGTYPAIAFFLPVVVSLKDPLGDRTVLDAAGQPVRDAGI